MPARTVAILTALLATGMAAAIDLRWSSTGSGVTDASGGDLTLRGTLGQPAITVATGGGLTLSGGVEPLVEQTDPTPCPGDTDDDADVDLSDLAQVLGQFGQTGAGLAGDTDADGDVDLSDLALVLANFGVACP